MNLLEQISSSILEYYHQLDPQMQLVWLVVSVLVPLIILALICFVAINSIHLYSSSKNNNLKKEIEKILIEFLFDEESENMDYVHKIKAWINENPRVMYRKREVSKNYIHEYHQNLKGELSYKLEWLYLSLNFDLYLIKKYKYSSTLNKIWIIRELSQMKCHRAIPLIEKNCHNSNESIRLEAQLSLITFKKFEALLFLLDLKTPLSNWNQLIILKVLEDISTKEKVLDPILFLRSSNDSIVTFGLKYAQLFFRLDKRDAIVELLNHINPEVQLEAINTLESLQIQDVFEELKKLYKTADESIKVRILQAIASLNPINENSFLKANFKKASDSVKFEIAKALKKNNPTINLEYLRAETENESLNFIEL